MTASTTLIHAREAVTGTRPDGSAIVVADATIAIAGGLVLEVGERASVAAKYPGAAATAFPRGTVFPGLVNGHHHVGITPFQAGVADLPLEPWIIRRIAAQAVPPYLDTLYSAFEMAASGITTVLHLYANRAASAEVMLAESREILRAYRDIGMRVSFAIMFFDQNAVGYVGDGVRDTLSPEETAAVGTFGSQGSMSLAEHEAVLAELRQDCAGDDRVRIQLAPGNLQWCSHGALERLAEIASSADMPVHMHLLETPTQRAYAEWRCEGRSPVSYLHGLGFKGPNVTLGHGVWLRREDIDELRQSGFSVCHNCSSNLRLSSGVAPVNDLLAAGVNVALGIDEAGLNDDRDMLTEMRLAMHLHKAMDPERPYGMPPARLLQMASEAGATTTGFGKAIGTLQAGSAADFFVFDADAAAYPGNREIWSAADLLLFRGKAQHVLATYVGGQPIYADGRFASVDRAAVLAEIAAGMKGGAAEQAGQMALLRSVEQKLVDAHAEARLTGGWFTR